MVAARQEAETEHAERARLEELEATEREQLHSLSTKVSQLAKEVRMCHPQRARTTIHNERAPPAATHSRTPYPAAIATVRTAHHAEIPELNNAWLKEAYPKPTRT